MQIDRYEPIEELLVEGGVRTTLCLDHVADREVVLKVVDGDLLPHEAWARLQRDAAAAVAAPGRVPPLEAGFDPALRSFRLVAPYVRGLTLAERLAGDGPLEATEALSVAQRVAAALATDHANGVLHGAVSPANVILGVGSGAVLIDLGMARCPSSAGALRDRLSSRAVYLAPELAGLVEREVDERADLYSLGMLLFASLAGRPPFAAGLADVLRHHAATEPPSLRALGVAVPRALDDLVRRLLSKDPADRGESAGAVADELDGIACALERGVPEPASPKAPATGAVGHPSFVGRIAELAELDRCLRDAQRGMARLVVVEGESGVGKSRLVETFCDRAAAAGAWIVRGEARANAAPQPLQLLSGVIDDVGSAMRRSDDLASAIIARVGRGADLLARAIPELGIADSSPPAGSAAPTPDGQPQLVHALAGLLDALGDPHRPAVVVLEDCQWGDELTLQVLREWMRDGERAPRHILVVATVRSEQLSPGHVLGHSAAARLTLTPLAPNQVTNLLRSMADDLPADAIEVIAGHARGNPLMVSALLLGLIESGALERRGDAWSFRPGRVPIQAARGSGAFLAGRLELLPAGTRELLAVAAVVGRTFDVGLVAAIADRSTEAVLAGLAEAESRHLVLQVDRLQFSFAHDRLRESLLAEITPHALQELHLRAARSIELLDRTRVFDLSFHYDAAGRDADAFEHACAAARIARDRHDFELAAHHLRIAERSADPASEPGFTIAEELGELLTLRGEYDAAEARLARARSCAPDTVAAARLEGRLGEVAFKRGDGRRSEEHLVAALELLGRSVPSPSSRYLWRLLRELLARAVRRAGARLRRRGVVNDERGQLEAQLLTRLAYAWWFNQPTFAALWLLTHQVNVAEARAAGAPVAHAQAIYGAAITAVLPALWRRGVRYTESARLGHVEVGNRWGEGQALAMKAAVLHARAMFQEGLEVARAARDILEQTGDQWELAFATWHEALCLYRLGRLDEAVEVARTVHRVGVELGAAQAEAIALEILAKAGVGTINPEAINEALERAGTDAHAIASAAQARACRLRSSGRRRAAIETLEATHARLRPLAFTNVYLAPLSSWLATLHREATEGHDPLAGAPEPSSRSTAARAARHAVRVSRVYRTEAPRAYRELAFVLASGGARRRADRMLRRSAAVARRQGARNELALTQLAADRLRLPPPAAGDALTRAEIQAACLDADAPAPDRPTLGLIERFDTILEAGSLLASAVSQADVAEAVAAASRQLLRADRCTVAGIDGMSANLPEHVEGAPFPEGPELIRRALGAKRPVCVKRAYFREAVHADRDGAPSVRSAICAPIVVDGAANAWFIAANTQVDDFFGADEERLAAFIARLGAAALARERLRRELRAGIIAAQESERARIARDLHDELGQSLTSILLGLRAAQKVAGTGSPGEPALADRLEGLRADANEALTALHRLAFELRPLVLDDLGFVAALRRLVADVEEKHGLVIEVASDLGGMERLPPDVETTAYRVTQEALTNVVRHAGAETASVLLAVTRGRVRVVIEDDGRGFEVGEAESRGFGLRGMSERAALVGGTVQVMSTQGVGTSVVLEVPVG